MMIMIIIITMIMILMAIETTMRANTVRVVHL